MLKKFKSSFENLKHTRTITSCSVLMAFAVILSQFDIRIETLKIGFEGIVTVIVGFIFGPVVCGIFGGLLDVLQHFIDPYGNYQFVWTINGILRGLIYGIILYKRAPSFKNILLSRFLTGILISTLLTTVWLCKYFGMAKLYELPTLAVKEIILIFIHSIIIHRILKVLKLESR